MAASTGPILAIGAITTANRVIVNGQEIDWRVPIGTALAAMGFAYAERWWPRPVVAMSWLALTALLFVRIDEGTPAPIESFYRWYQGR